MDYKREWPLRIAAAVTSVSVAPWLVATAYYFANPTLRLETDSTGYLAWSPDRSSGYPLFLDLVRGPSLLPIQLFLFASAVSWLAWYVYIRTKNLLLVTVLTLAVVANPYLWQLQGSVMSEALTTPLLTILVGLLAGYLVRPKVPTALSMSFVVGLLAATRPSNVALTPLPIIAVFIRPPISGHSKISDAGRCFLIMFAVLLADQVCARAVHGSAKTSLLGRHAFAKSVLIDAPPLSRAKLNPVEQRLATLAENRFEVVRQVLKSVSDRPQVSEALLGNYEVCLQYACADAAIGNIGVPRAELNKYLFHVGAARLRENPSGYLLLAAKEYRGLWILNPRKDPRFAQKFNAYLATHDALPFEAQLGEPVQPVSASETSHIGAVLRSCFALLGTVLAALTVALSVLQLGGWSRSLLTGAWLYLVATQAVLLFCALAGIGTPRYTMGMWPTIAAALAFILTFLIEGLHHRVAATMARDASLSSWKGRRAC